MTARRPRTEIVWTEILARDLAVGDLIANHATCTAVTVGPAPADDDWPHRDLHRGEVRYRCGESYGSLGRGTRPVIVGRKAGS